MNCDFVFLRLIDRICGLLRRKRHSVEAERWLHIPAIYASVNTNVEQAIVFSVANEFILACKSGQCCEATKIRIPPGNSMLKRSYKDKFDVSLPITWFLVPEVSKAF